MTPDYSYAQIAAFRQLFAYSPEQCVAFSFVALETAQPGAWRQIIPQRLSFTEPGWGPLEQIFGTSGEGFRRLSVIPGSPAGLGFTADRDPDGTVNAEGARRKRNQWVIFLNRPDDT